MSTLTSFLVLLSLLRYGQGTSDSGWLANALTDMKFLLQDGTPSGFPKLDPVPVIFQFYVDNDMFRGSVSVNGMLSGYSNYYVTNATFNPNLYLDVDVVFVSTTFEGYYSLDANAYKGVIPVQGSGPVKAYFSFIEVETNGTIIGKNEIVQFKDIDLNIKHINAIQVTAGGLLKNYGLDEVLQVALKDSLGTGIKLFKGDLGILFSKLIMTEGNRALRRFSISTFLEMIKHFNH